MEKFITEQHYSKFGHFGTHFDIMQGVFPLEYCRRNGKIFDVSFVKEREIFIEDINTAEISADDFVIFYTGTMQKEGYGTTEYFNSGPEFSKELIDFLIEKKVSLIGFDMAGICRVERHAIVDQYCADNGIFIIENLDNLQSLIKKTSPFIVHTYPLKLKGYSGLPSRVIAEIN